MVSYLRICWAFRVGGGVCRGSMLGGLGHVRKHAEHVGNASKHHALLLRLLSFY